MGEEQKGILGTGLLLKLIAAVLAISTICIIGFNGCPPEPLPDCPILRDTLYLYECQDSTLELCPRLDSRLVSSANQFQWFNESGTSVFGPSSDSCFQISSLDSLTNGKYYCEINNTRTNVCCKREVIVQMYETDSLEGKVFPDQLIVLFEDNTPKAKMDSVRDEVFHAKLIDQCVCDSLQLWQLFSDTIFIGELNSPNRDTIFIEEMGTAKIRKEEWNIEEIEFNRPTESNSFGYEQKNHSRLAMNENSMEKLNEAPPTISPLGDTIIRVAIIDNGIDTSHNKLIGKFWKNSDELPDMIDNDGNCAKEDFNGYNFHFQDAFPFPRDTTESHGTHVAGIIDSVFRMYRTPNSLTRIEIINVQVLDNNGGDLFDLICGVFYSVGKKADVINISMGWQGGEVSQILKLALSSGNSACGSLIVSSAGNNNQNTDFPNTRHYPSGYSLDNIIEVAAADSTSRGNKEEYFIQNNGYSNYGDSVDIAALGVWESTIPGSSRSKMGKKTGTSMSAAYVTGLVASILSRKPKANKYEVKKILLNNLALPGRLQGKSIRVIDKDLVLNRIQNLSISLDTCTLNR